MHGPSRRWWVCGMLLAAAAISYIDRQTLSFVSPLVMKEFGLTNEQLGRVLSAFLLAYTFGQLLAGPFFDAVGNRVGFAVSIGVWSLANTLTALAGGFWSLASCRFLLGLGEAGNFPGGVKVVNDWFPSHERAFAGGLFTSGASIGAVVAGPLVSSIAHAWGWRAAFALPGSLGFLWLAGWWLLYRDPDKTAKTPGDSDEWPARWLDLLRLRPVWALTVARFFEESAFWVWLFWLPKYLSSAHALSVRQTGWLLTLPFLALDLGYLSGGWISSRLVQRGWPAPDSKRAVMIAAALLMLASVPAAGASRLLAFVPLISLCLIGHGAWFTNALTLPADLAPRGLVASFYGINALGGRTRRRPGQRPHRASPWTATTRMRPSSSPPESCRSWRPPSGCSSEARPTADAEPGAGALPASVPETTIDGGCGLPARRRTRPTRSSP